PLPFSLPALLTFLPPASPPLALHPSPPRRSSDLPHHHASRALRRAGSLRPLDPVAKPAKPAVRAAPAARSDVPAALRPAGAGLTDRKSTRLNSSHVSISYADFCLKKKIQQETAYA